MECKERIVKRYKHKTKKYEKYINGLTNDSFCFVNCSYDPQLDCILNSDVAKTDKKAYICVQCIMKFQTLESLEEHLTNHRNIKLSLDFSCRRCGMTYRYKCDLINHMLVHIQDIFAEIEIKRTSPDKIYNHPNVQQESDAILTDIEINDAYECLQQDITNEKRISQTENQTKEETKDEDIDLKRRYLRKKLHNESETNRKEMFKCDHCNYSTLRKDQLSKHLVIHGSQKPYNCHLCDFSTKWKTVLRKHILKHSNVRPFECDKCKFKTQLSYDLKTHKIKHENAAFVCEVCGRGFKRLVHLIEHKRTHSNEKPFACSHCAYRCKTSKALKTHIGGHTKERMFCCDICGYKTPRDDYMRKHKRIHSIVDPFHCKVCDFSCRAYATLKLHRKIHSGLEVYSCAECDYKSVSDRAVKRHLRVHKTNLPNSDIIKQSPDP